MFEIKTERDYLLAKKELEKAPTWIGFSWIVGAIIFIVGITLHFWAWSVGINQPIIVITGIMAILLFIIAMILTALKNRYEVEIELWKKQQNKTNQRFCQSCGKYSEVDSNFCPYCGSER